MGHPSRLGLIDSQEPVERDHPLNQGLVAWWLGLPNNSGGGTLFDLCGKYPGTLTNGPTWSPGPRGFGGLWFDGSDDCVQASNVDLSGNPVVMISGWINADSWKTTNGQYDMVWEHTANGGATVGGIAFYNSGASSERMTICHYGNVGGSVAFTGSRPSLGVWTHITCIHDFTRPTSELTFYQNGIQQGLVYGINSNNTDTGFAVSTFNIGRRNNTSLPFDGRIADLRIHNLNATPPATAIIDLYYQSLRGHPDTLRRYSTTVYYLPPESAATPLAGYFPGGVSSDCDLIDSQEPIERDHPLNAGLVAWWLGLDGNWGGSTLHDLCGSYPGTLTNGPTWSEGPHGFAGLTLDGSNDYVSTPSISLAGASQSFTLSLWLRHTSTTGYIAFWDKGSGTNSRPWQFFYNQDAGRYLRFQQYNGTLNPRADTTAVSNDGNWHLFTAVRDCENSQMYIYIDGVNRTTAQNNVGFTTNFDDTSTTVIGQPRNGVVNYFAGSFGGASAYNRALSAAEVFALYEQSLRGHPDTLRRYSTAAWFVPDAGGGGGFQAAWARGSNVVVGGLGRC